MNRILIIQTAFIGDVILATSLIENIHHKFPEAKIDFLLRKGNEGLLFNHPYLNQLYIWDKGKGKFINLLKTIRLLRKTKYDEVINCHRYFSSGLISLFQRAKNKTGFDNNPLSIFFTRTIKHEIGNGKHEIERNQGLIAHLTDEPVMKPRLYPSEKEFIKVAPCQSQPYICIAPCSVWFTKQLPVSKWIELIRKTPAGYSVILIGGKPDYESCENIIEQSGKANCTNLAGKLSFLETAALMSHAAMNYVNDSAPLHIASSMDAPVTAFFCSTVPSFGFGPLSSKSKIAEINHPLECRPCGIHGKKECPLHHFKCGFEMDIDQVLLPEI